MRFETLTGLYLLAFIVPLIIIYLIKAKPKEIKVPSLIFFSEDRKTKKYNSMLQKLLIMLLFFLQLLFIILIAMSAANPVVQLPMDAFSVNTVAVIDVSASMGTKDDFRTTRMEAQRDALLKQIKGKASIILAEENPVVLAKNVSAMRARALIQNLEPKDVPTRLDSAILLANELLGKERANILVYSDLQLEKDDDIAAAKKIAEVDNKRVLFIPTGQKQSNLGFISVGFQGGKGEALIKNFGDSEKTFDVRFLSSRKDSVRLSVAAKSIESLTFEIPQGDTILQISEQDRLDSDNRVFVYNPFSTKSRILFITNREKNNPILDALRANPTFDVSVTVPPVVPDLKYDLVIFSDVDKNLLLPNTFREINRYKNGGGKVIIAAQQGIDAFDFGDLIDFRIGPAIPNEEPVRVDMQTQFTKQLPQSSQGFTSTRGHYNIAKSKNSTAVIASTASKVPVLVMETNLFYYGIQDSSSGFKDQIDYPLFWDALVNFMLGRQSINDYNFKAGDIMIGANSSEKILLDKAGIYSYGERRIAVNLFNEEESNIFKDSLLSQSSELETKYEKVNLEYNLDIVLLIAAIAVMLYELYYIKKRGDL